MSGLPQDNSPVDAGENQTDAHIQGNEPVKKPEPKPWPKRRRPPDNYNEAMHFIGQAILHFETQLKIKLSIENLGKLVVLYNNWCWNTGLRGKEKAAMWRIVKAQMLEAKASAPNRTQEL